MSLLADRRSAAVDAVRDERDVSALFIVGLPATTIGASMRASVETRALTHAQQNVCPRPLWRTRFVGLMMAYRNQRDRDEDEQLAEALSAVASPVRLALLRVLREPRVLTEIEVGAIAESAWGDADRLLSRQTVKTHVDRLVETGAVSVRETSRAGRATVEYVLNHQSLFALSEKFRSLALLRPTAEPDQVTLVGEDAVRATLALQGPRLVLVKGLDEGRVWRLDDERADEWHLGRARHAEIRLDYDPYVSSEHARIVRTLERYRIEPAPGSVNPTRVNFEPVREGAVDLFDGDTVGVGRSILLFRERAAGKRS